MPKKLIKNPLKNPTNEPFQTWRPFLWPYFPESMNRRKCPKLTKYWRKRGTALTIYLSDTNFERTVLFAKLHSNVVVDILYLVRDPRGMENSREQLKKNTEQIWTPQSQEMSLNMNYRRNVCETSFEIGYIFLVYN